jgi:hypothetical protein
MSQQFSFIAVAALLVALGARVVRADEKDKQIADLQDRVAKLEAKIADLQKQLAPLLAKSDNEAQRAKLAARARERMRKDGQTHTAEQINDAEQLYQVANKNWRSPEAKESLKKMIEKYPDLNRTGCAVLYLGQMTENDPAERERLLKLAIDKYGDCFYGDGVQVGALARYFLAAQYDKGGQPDKAKALRDELRRDYPDAINHRGEPLVASNAEE